MFLNNRLRAIINFNETQHRKYLGEALLSKFFISAICRGVQAADKFITHHSSFITCLLSLFILLSSFSSLAQKPKPPKPIYPIAVESGKLVYNADSVTGDRVPDFSYAGYKASEEQITFVPVKIVVPVVKGDATATIQAAINEVAKLPIDKNGFRGAVLFSKGIYEVVGQIHLTQSGIVLRGFGAKGETIIKGTGIDRDGLIRVFGKDDKTSGAAIEVADDYVPVNAMSFSVANAAAFKVGDRITVHRPSAKEWIETLGTWSFGGGLSSLGWKPGDVDLFFDRKITAIKGNIISIDVPITTSLDKKYGGGFVSSYQWPGRISNIGIENITLVSDYDKSNPKDDYHRWMAITMDNVEDAWVRQVSFKHFAGSAVYILDGGKRITIEDCIATDPVSEIGGQRRYTFFTRGQQTLFQRCYAQDGYHDFATGHCATGPNAFVQCVSILPHSFSGAIDRWASGILFDVMKVDGNAIRLGNRGQDGQGAGWTAANSLLWNSTAALIECPKPPTAQNYAIGAWSQFTGDGFWNESNNWVSPVSLFYAQLETRLKKDVSRQAQLIPTGTEASSSPSVEVAQELTKQASQPLLEMDEWIAQASQRNPISTNSKGAKLQKVVNSDALSVHLRQSPPLKLQNGKLLLGDKIATGRIQDVPWWSGGVEGKDLKTAKQKPSVTRFVPGRVGAGLTDDLQGVVDSMQSRNAIALHHNYGLWYDRRRDDHERIRRMDGEVWPPFYELPFARSGKETAWDGLSKYDLTKYNPWYWSRLEAFANKADMNGLILIHENYFQHNIIEAGAHYADFPWRTANNINNTGFVEPVNYAGDKRIFYAEQFYDLTNPVRKELHKKYIWKSLENFQFNHNVIQSISEEYTGPLHFVQFWLDCISSWPLYKKVNPLVALGATKDVQDAVLQDPKYASVVDIIDIKYWHYQADGSAYAPEGGKNLAPRQWARLLKPKPTSFEQVYRAVLEYRTKYPDKAVIYSGDGYDRYGWAVFMAGGSLPVLPQNTDKEFLKAAAEMKPVEGISTYALAGENGVIVYGGEKQPINLKNFNGRFKVRFVNSESGELIGREKSTTRGSSIHIDVPQGTDLVWLSKM